MRLFLYRVLAKLADRLAKKPRLKDQQSLYKWMTARPDFEASEHQLPEVLDVFRGPWGYVYFIVGRVSLEEAVYDIIRDANQGSEGRLCCLHAYVAGDTRLELHQAAVLDQSNVVNMAMRLTDEQLPPPLRPSLPGSRIQQKFKDCISNNTDVHLGPHPATYMLMCQPAFERYHPDFQNHPAVLLANT